MQSLLPDILRKDRDRIHAQWMTELTPSLRNDRRIGEQELSAETGEFLRVLAEAASGGLDGFESPRWEAVFEFLGETAKSRAAQGFTQGEIASFVLSLKKPLFSLLRATPNLDAAALGEEVWNTTELVDRLGVHTLEVYQRAREEVIRRQQQEILELSTPVVKLWDGVLALPMIGTLDSARAQTVMESLLENIVQTGSAIAIIDITGVPTVDTLVAQHLLKTVSAIRLMGADCIISGIRPQIAQTIVHLGINLEGVSTRATLADALALALRRSGLTVTSAKA